MSVEHLKEVFEYLEAQIRIVRKLIDENIEKADMDQVSDEKSPSIDGKPVMITIPQSAPNRLMPEDIKAPSANEALQKYCELRVQHKRAEVVSGGNCAESSAHNKTARGGEAKYTGITAVKGGDMAEKEKKQSSDVKYVGIRAIYAVPNGFRKPGGEMPEKKQSTDVNGAKYSRTNALKTAAKRGKKIKPNVSHVKIAGISAISTSTKGGRLSDEKQLRRAILKLLAVPRAGEAV